VDPQPPAEWAPQFEFRCLFALGAAPAFVVFLASFKDGESASFQSAIRTRPQRNLCGALSREPPQTWKTLLGTAGTWFCYDIVCYGTNVFVPTILDSICLSGTKDDGKCNQTLLQNSLQSVIVSAMGIPGCLLAIKSISWMGSKRLNVYGLLLLCINLIAMAVVYTKSPDSSNTLFSLFCSLSFLTNYGPNLGTFVLPAICFPVHIRSTCYGLSAFGGKLGAVIGTLLFPIVSSSAIGLPGVLLLQAGTCLVGAILSQATLKNDWNYLSSDDHIAVQSFIHGGSIVDNGNGNSIVSN